MIRIILLSTIFACSSDVSIMKRYDEKQNSDSAIADVTDIETQIESGDDTQTSEPSDEMTDLVSGYGEIHFRQIACPSCVGAASEFDITATLKLHYPTSGDYTDYLYNKFNANTYKRPTITNNTASSI